MKIKFLAGPGRGDDKVNIRIKGLKALNKRFEKLKLKSDSEMTRQLHLAADRIARNALRDVPVDTGKLLGSIKVVKRNRWAEVQVNADYAAYVEGRDNTGARRGRQKPQPFFFKHIEPSIAKMNIAIKKLI